MLGKIMAGIGVLVFVIVVLCTIYAMITGQGWVD